MVQQFDRLVVGTRFKMSELGAARCPELADQTGLVVEVSHRTTAVTVLLDGDKRPTYLHRDYHPDLGSWIVEPIGRGPRKLQTMRMCQFQTEVIQTVNYVGGHAETGVHRRDWRVRQLGRERQSLNPRKS
jgi:hypothetical protein